MADAAIVQTDSGPVRGIVTDEYRLFQGIPYAASTGRGQRWRSPEPVRAWSEPRDATKPGNICAQQPSVYADVASLEEDCLFLNVTTPRWTGADWLRPVMVWIHGDGAIGGGSFFDARRLVITGDVIVVTINYRLGVFGTFGYPGMDGSGTFGLRISGRHCSGFSATPRHSGRPRQRDVVRGVLRRIGYQRAPVLARVAGPVPPGHHSERLRLDGPAGGRAVSRRACG